ncbi:MAG: response regulator [Chitinophagaceae bacterium]|nr:response regulator [Chitinophagaceae bacterium]
MPQSRPSNNGKIILIGEDDLDDQEILDEIFSSIDTNFAVTFLPNGTEVIAYLQGQDEGPLPCLIVLDYNMPGLNGAEILQELRKNSRYDNIPKVIWSTSNSTTYKEICLDLGANDYVVKPSNVNDLVMVAKHMLSFCS